MGILIACVAVLSACYAPGAPDCERTCDTSADCVHDQACIDHRCAAPSTACILVDAGPQPDVRIGAPAIDAALTVDLHIHVDGDGEVDLHGISACASDCVLQVPAAVGLTLVASPHAGKVFDKWTSPPCNVQPATCTFTPIGTTAVGAKFRGSNDQP